MKNTIRLLCMMLLAAALSMAGCENNKDDNSSLLLLFLGGGADAVVDIAEIPGVTPPAYGETPVTEITETDQYTGTVSWSDSPVTFDALTVYTATITLTAKTGFTLTGVAADFFTVAGADTVTNDADTGVVTAVFPETGAAPPAVIDIDEIAGVTPPAYGETPVSTITETDQYTGTIAWSLLHGTFQPDTAYTATITLTAKTGFTLTGVAADFFTVSGADTVTNDADSGVVTVEFPATGPVPPAVIDIDEIAGVTPPAYGETPVSTITETDQYTGTIAWSLLHGTFQPETVYTATITLTAKTGFTLTGVAADFFTVSGADTVTNDADSGVVTVVFPATGPVPPAVINIDVITGVTAPAYGATPVTEITETAQYTGTVSWSGSPVKFDATTVYTATITLTAKSGYTLTGVAADFFTVAESTSNTNPADSGVVTAVFPATGATPYAGCKETYTADGVSFKMSYVPGGHTFPTGVNDDGTATVADACWIGETEVTYELWKKVYDWATSGSGATGAGEYTFANAGGRGGYYIGFSYVAYDSGHETHPVTMVNWRDSMVWCNALTEWYNAQMGTSYVCVYTYSDTIIRDSQDSNATACDGAVASSTAKGFRLLTSNEWELAARYRDGTLWTYGDHASGDDSGACFDDVYILGGLGMSTIFGDYAVYSLNSGSSTAVVKSKTTGYNALGLYDMSGNVWEWCFDLSGSYRVSRGGSWNNYAGNLRVGGVNSYDAPYDESSNIGFRFTRTQ